MKKDFDLFIATMPDTRKADYYFGCLDSSVFIDFNRSHDNLIYLVRISFDGYGCCNLDELSHCLNTEESQCFIKEMEKRKFDQMTMIKLIKEAINLNKKHIWGDALKEYELM